MSIEVKILSGPLSELLMRPETLAGAVVVFEGIVRPIEGGRTISGLQYDVYDPMALREMQRLAESIFHDFDLSAVVALHSCGFVPAGQCSFKLLIAAQHRKPALAAMDWFIDALKRDVPIWKHPIWNTPFDALAGEE